MRNALFWPGMLVSGVYLFFMHLLIGDRYSTFTSMELNTLGDFLAGAFSPLAFLWLVLGFLQQGRELSISSAALRAQADELKNSVEQHKDMVDLTRNQLELEHQNLEMRDDRHRKAISPLFAAGCEVQQLADSFNIRLSFTNQGERVTKAGVDFSAGLSHLKKILPDFPKLHTENFNIPCNAGDPRFAGTVSISYFDIDQNEGVKIFDLVMVPPSARNVSPSVTITPRD